MRTPRPPRCHTMEPERIFEEFASDSIFREKCSGENLSVLASCHWHLPLCRRVFTYKPVQLHHSFWWDNHPPHLHLILDKQDPNSKLQASSDNSMEYQACNTWIQRKVAAEKDSKSWERGMEEESKKIGSFSSYQQDHFVKDGFLNPHRDGMGQDWISHPHFLMTFL